MSNHANLPLNNEDNVKNMTENTDLNPNQSTTESHDVELNVNN